MSIFRYTFLMSPSQKSTFVPPQNPSKPGTPEWLYDEIMRNIEPDLLTTALSTHDERYNDETKEQRAARLHAYDQAFMIFDNVTGDFEKEFHEKMETVRKKAKKKAMKEDKKKLKSIEEEIDEQK